jgi:hypothetical protein
VFSVSLTSSTKTNTQMSMLTLLGLSLASLHTAPGR